jgi:transposase
MALRHTITDEQWDKIKDALPGKVGDRGRTAEDNRLFIDAVMWMSKTGAPWRDLPACMASGQQYTNDLFDGQKMVSGK